MKRAFFCIFSIIGGIFLLGILACGVLAIGVVGTVTADPTPTPTPSSPLVPIRISAIELVEAYEANEVAAKVQYEDKYLEVFGLVDSISETGGNHSLQFDIGSRLLFSMSCFFAEENIDQFIPLRAGEHTTIRGYGDGMNAFGVNIRDCMVVSGP